MYYSQYDTAIYITMHIYNIFWFLIKFFNWMAINRWYRSFRYQESKKINYHSPLIEVILCIVQPQANCHCIALPALREDVIHFGW